MLLELSLESINRLDYGKAAVAFQRKLEEAVEDCNDRPGDKRARKITLTLILKPVCITNGNTIDCEEITGTFAINSNIPKHETDEISFGIRKNKLVFQEDANDDFRQDTYLDEKNVYPDQKSRAVAN